MQVRILMFFGLSVVTLHVWPCSVRSQEETRYFDHGGWKYRETKTRVRVPVRELRFEDQQQTFYEPEYKTEFQTYQRPIYQPVTQYQWEPRWHGWWNIFDGPHLAYHLRPTTVWQSGTQTIRIPVTRQEFVPETRTVRVAIPQLKFIEKDQVTRTAIAPSATQSMATRPAATDATSVNPAYRTATPVYVAPFTTPAYVPAPFYSQYPSRYDGAFGGIARLNDDPPRYGIPASGTWQARR